MLLENARSGQTASQQLHGKSLFEYFQAHQREGRLFDAAMTENAAPGAEDIVAIDGPTIVALDDGPTIVALDRKFSRWLHALQHAQEPRTTVIPRLVDEEETPCIELERFRARPTTVKLWREHKRSIMASIDRERMQG
jgi:hypothetical protein